MITDDKQFHACRVCILDKLIGIHRVYTLLVFAQAKRRVPYVTFIITRNRCFASLRGNVVLRLYVCRLTLTFLHTHLVEKIQFGNAQTAVSNMQTTVTTCYSLFGYVTCRWSTPHRRLEYRSYNIEMVVINHWGFTRILVRTYSITMEYYFHRC